MFNKIKNFLFQTKIIAIILLIIFTFVAQKQIKTKIETIEVKNSLIESLKNDIEFTKNEITVKDYERSIIEEENNSQIKKTINPVNVISELKPLLITILTNKKSQKLGNFKVKNIRKKNKECFNKVSVSFTIFDSKSNSKHFTNIDEGSIRLAIKNLSKLEIQNKSPQLNQYYFELSK